MEGVLWGQLVCRPQAAVAVSALDAGDLSSCEGLGARPSAVGFFRSCPGCDHQPPSACLLRCRAGSSPKTGETSWGAGSREQIAETTTLPPRPARRAAELCFFSFFSLFASLPLLLAQGREAQQEQAQHAARRHPADPLPRQGRPWRVGVRRHQRRRKHYCQHSPYSCRYGQEGATGPWGQLVAGTVCSWVVTHGVGMLPVMSNVSLDYNFPVVLHSLFLYFGHLRVWISRNPA